MLLSLTIVVRRQIETGNAGKTLWRSKWGSFTAASCRDQCWVGIDVSTGRDRLRQMSWRQGIEIPSETSTLSEVAKRWLQGDLSKLQIKSITIVKPLICALNSALNLDKPLTASRFVIKALRPFTESVCLVLSSCLAFKSTQFSCTHNVPRNITLCDPYHLFGSRGDSYSGWVVSFPFATPTGTGWCHCGSRLDRGLSASVLEFFDHFRVYWLTSFGRKWTPNKLILISIVYNSIIMQPKKWPQYTHCICHGSQMSWETWRTIFRLPSPFFPVSNLHNRMLWICLLYWESDLLYSDLHGLNSLGACVQIGRN